MGNLLRLVAKTTVPKLCISCIPQNKVFQGGRLCRFCAQTTVIKGVQQLLTADIYGTTASLIPAIGAVICICPCFVARACQATTGGAWGGVSTHSKGISTVIIKQGDATIGAEDKTLYFRAAAVTDSEIVNCSVRMISITGSIAV